MGSIKVKIDRLGSEPEVIDLDLSLDTMTMRESVRVESALGPELFERLVKHGFQGDVSPRVIQAVIYAKLKTVRPEIELDDFDLDLEELQGALEDDPKAAPSNGGSSE